MDAGLSLVRCELRWHVREVLLEEVGQLRDRGRHVFLLVVHVDVRGALDPEQLLRLGRQLDRLAASGRVADTWPPAAKMGATTDGVARERSQQ